MKEAIEEHDGKFEWVLNKLENDNATKAYQFAKDNLPTLVKELAIMDGLVEVGQTKEEAWVSYSAYIQSKLKEGRKKEWVGLSAEILGMILTKKAPIPALILATQKAYHLIVASKKK